MAIPLVERVNPVTGRKGMVAATSRAARLYKAPPSARATQPDTDPGAPVTGNGDNAGEPDGPQMPGENARTETWRDFALATTDLPPEQVSTMTRAQLVDHFKSES